MLKTKKQFDGKNTRFLLISSFYFLAGEIERACNRLGVACKHLAFETQEMELEEFRQTIIKEVKSYRPDAILTINHSGVDREGILIGLLEELQIPLISWFVDNPHLLISHYSNMLSEWIHVFTWDKDNIESLKAEGFKNTYYLPLGTDIERFHPRNLKKTPLPKEWKSGVSFVGTSMSYKVEKRLEKSGFPKEYIQDFLDLALDFVKSKERSIEAFIHDQINPKYQNLKNLYHNMPEKEAKNAFQAGLTWEATRVYRLSCVEKLLDFRPLIVGDEGWKTFFPKTEKRWRWHDAINYYDALPYFYPQSIINFNCTSMQMKNATNQRILDVPACGAFVLTDYREQMLDMFEISGKNQEIVCYKDQEEIPDLIRFYINHEKERNDIINAGRKRIVDCHTWDHRVLKVIEIMSSL